MLQGFGKGTQIGSPPGRVYVVTDSSVIGFGAGSAGVFQGQETISGEIVAIKIIDRSREVDPAWKHSFQRELDIAIKLVHPNVIELKDVIFQDRFVCLVMEHAGGGELFQQVARYGALPEHLARVYFQQIVSAIQYCHSLGVCHRDLKLENCLLASPGSNILKITDFGLSKDAQQHSQPRTKRVGTISYMAPEVALATGMEPYNGEAADVWSLGVILFVLLCCEYPFGFDGPAEQGGQPTQRCCSYPPHTSCFPTPKRGMLTADLAHRLTLEEIGSHSWFFAPTDDAFSGDKRSPEANPVDVLNPAQPAHENGPTKEIDWWVFSYVMMFTAPNNYIEMWGRSQAPELPMLPSASMSIDSEFDFGDDLDEDFT